MRQHTNTCSTAEACGPLCYQGNTNACKIVRDERVAACKGSDKSQCAEAGTLIAAGRGGPPDVKQGLVFLDQGCSAEDPRACRQRAMWAMQGVGAAKNIERAKELVNRALGVFATRCKEKADGNACVEEGFLARGVMDFDPVSQTPTSVTPADLPRSKEAMRRGCDFGDPAACIEVARPLRFDPAVNEPRRAAAIADLACAKAKNYFLCVAASELVDPAKDPEIANRIGKRTVDLANAECSNGDARACYVLTERYLHGVGVRASRNLSDRYASKGARAMKAVCRNWDQCVETLRIISPITDGQRAELQLALKDQVKRGCREGYWQACEIAAAHMHITFDQLGDALDDACKKKQTIPCAHFAAMFRDRFAPMKHDFVKRCDSEHDGDACWVLSLEGLTPPAPGQPFPQQIMAERQAYLKKSCEYNGRGCVAPVFPFSVGRFF